METTPFENLRIYQETLELVKIIYKMNSRGSIYEVMATLDIALSQGFIDESDKLTIRERPFSILKQLNSLISYYRNH